MHQDHRAGDRRARLCRRGRSECGQWPRLQLLAFLPPKSRELACRGRRRRFGGRRGVRGLARAVGGCAAGGATDDHVQAALGIAGTQELLVALADAGAGYLVDEGPALGQPPPDYAVSEVRPQVLRSNRAARRPRDACERSLAPPLVRRGDDRGLADGRIGQESSLQVQRGDPLAARLDDVLRPVADRDVASCVNAADIAGPEPAVVKLSRCRVEIVALGHPGPAYLDLADAAPVPWQYR